MAQDKGFKVIIAGGGVAGLTLAAILEKFDIDYILLEGHGDIAPEVGASIGLFPNGLRILDQIGCYEAVKALPGNIFNHIYTRDEHGKAICNLTDAAFHMEQWQGYYLMFFDRQWLLRTLYDHLVHKDRVKLKKKVFQVNLAQGGVEVLTTDGDRFKGSIVVGADGVHSTVRAEMFRLASELQPGYLDQAEPDRVPCYYKCSFGIAKDVPNWDYDDTHMVQGDGVSQLVISGPEGRVYWFFFCQLPETRFGKEIPRYTAEDEAQFFKEKAHWPITETITFGQVYERRISSTLTPLHEQVFDKWHFRRIFILGDAAHKPNPIGGQGGNNAIESTAALVNALLEARDGRGGSLENMSDKEIEQVFSRALAVRHERAKTFVKVAHKTQSVFAKEKPWLTKVLLLLENLRGPDAALERLCAICRGGIRITKLPIPKRPRMIPYDDELPARPIHSKANLLVQLLVVSVMLFLIYVSQHANRLPYGRMVWAREGPTLDREWISGVPALNNTFNRILSFFSLIVGAPEIGPNVHAANFFLAQMTSFVMIWIVESYRIGNKGTLISVPIIALLAMHTQALMIIGPLYFILAVFEGFDQAPGRYIRPAVAKSLVPALMLGYILPTILLAVPIANTRALQAYSVLWQPAPALVAVLVSVFSRLITWWDRPRAQDKTDNKAGEGVQGVKAGQNKQQQHVGDAKMPSEASLERYKNLDLATLQTAYTVLFWVQAIAHISTVLYAYHHPDLSPTHVFFDLPSPFAADWGLAEPAALLAAFMRHDLPISAAALFAYKLFSIWKLRQVGYVTTPRAALAVLAVTLGQLTIGPGATWAALWSWREDVLANVVPVR